MAYPFKNIPIQPKLTTTSHSYFFETVQKTKNVLSLSFQKVYNDLSIKNMPSLISFYKSIYNIFNAQIQNLKINRSSEQQMELNDKNTINNILNHMITLVGVNNIVKVANNKLQMLNFAKYNINSVAPDLVKFTPITHRLYERKTVYTPFTHPFHIVDPSPWPFCTSIALWFGALNTMAMVHNYVTVNIASGLMALFYLLFSLAGWWRDVIRESTYEFKHTAYVRRGLLLGMMLFIISEVMFFFGFFWAFFHSSLVPSPAIGGVWPPVTIMVISPWKLPLVNTLLLLLSGVTLTIGHRFLVYLPYYNKAEDAIHKIISVIMLWLRRTIYLGVFFLFCQAFEYYFAAFTFQDTVYGGTFYILTGLHGLHVLVGTIFLIVCLWRTSLFHFTVWKQVGFKSAEFTPTRITQASMLTRSNYFRNAKNHRNFSTNEGGTKKRKPLTVICIGAAAQRPTTPFYNSAGYDERGYDRRGYDCHGFDSMGYNEDGMNAYGFFWCLNLFHQNTEKPGYDIWGFDSKGYDPEGFNCFGFNRNLYDRDGFDAYSGQTSDGFNRQGLDSYGYNRAGYGRDGFDICGKNCKGLTLQDLKNRKWSVHRIIYNDTFYWCYDADHDDYFMDNVSIYFDESNKNNIIIEVHEHNTDDIIIYLDLLYKNNIILKVADPKKSNVKIIEGFFF